jgi:hypothetical protein
MTTPTSIEPSRLPATIRGSLAARRARDTEAALRTFSAVAELIDAPARAAADEHGARRESP